MPGGGRQPGAGRPKGVPSKSSLTIIEEAKRTGLLPAQVMLNNMRDAYSSYLSLKEGLLTKPPEERSMDDVDNVIRFMDLSQRYAVDCANYYHPKLASITVEKDDTSKTEVVFHGGLGSADEFAPPPPEDVAGTDGSESEGTPGSEDAEFKDAAE